MFRLMALQILYRSRNTQVQGGVREIHASSLVRVYIVNRLSKYLAAAKVRTSCMEVPAGLCTCSL